MASKYGNLPAAFVKKIGREETKKLLYPSGKPQRVRSNPTPDHEKVDRFIQKHEMFTAGLCAKLCSLKKEIVIPILNDRTDLKVAADGTYTRNPTVLM